MSTRYSETALAEAAAAIQTSQAYQAGKGERFLNTFGDKVLAVSGSQALSTVQNVTASAAFDLVKNQVSNFVESSKVLVNVLDEVGKAHPFIQLAVSTFKAAITLELARRENDQKVIALNTTMCDMMQVMTLLKKVASPKNQGSDGMSIEQRLQGRMGSIVDSIKRCAKLCDSYQKRHTAVKFFTSIKWQTKFADLAGQFVTHKSNIESDLQLHISITVTNTSDTLASVNEKVTVMTAMMGVVFEKMQTTEEKDWAAFARQNGGIERVLESDLLMKKVVDKQKGGTKEEKGAKSMTLAEFERELGKDVEGVLADNTKAFEQKFGAIELSLREVSVTIQRQSDRVIEEVLAGMHAGPHERIVDKDLYHIWKEMGWKGNVKATHLVMALHDHFTFKAARASHMLTMNSNESQSGEPLKTENHTQTITGTLPETPVEDLWALEYISVNRVQPLIEALDDDGSMFVTVNEVNEFTGRRPEGWSLPRWIAYWTTGFELTSNWYWRRIHKNLHLAVAAYADILPANRAASSHLFHWSVLSNCSNVLSGLRGVHDWDDTDWSSDMLFFRFKDYVLDEERKLKTILRRLSYNIDQDNTLQTLTGGGRPEEYALPLLCLLLERVVWTMDIAKDTLVSPYEFMMLGASISTVVADMQNRATKLQAIYKLQNVNKLEKLEAVFFGIYSCVFTSHEQSENWTFGPEDYSLVSDADLGELEVPEPPLFYEPAPEEIDFLIDSTFFVEQGVTDNGVVIPDVVSSNSSSSFGLVGTWSGTYTHHRDQPNEYLWSISITEQNVDGTFNGSGIDVEGAFTVVGTIEGSKVTFTTSYTMNDAVQKCIATLDMEAGTIVGQWGTEEMELESVPVSAIENGTQSDHRQEGTNEDSGGSQLSAEQVPQCDIEIIVEDPTPEEKAAEAVNDWDGGGGDDNVSDAESNLSSIRTDATEAFSGGGTFSLVRRPVDYFLYRPSDTEFQKNRPKALWKMVQNAARQWYRSRHLIWDVLKERRDQRNRYTELLLKREEEGRLHDPEEAAEWAQISKQTNPKDLHLWQAITRYKQRRSIQNSDLLCDNCGESINGSRLLCSDCTEGGWSDSVDLCANCWSATCSRERDNKDHFPTHTLVQLRLPSPQSEHAYIFERANEIVESSKEQLSAGVEVSCRACDKVITETPYWCCMLCTNVYVCIDCNLSTEGEKPWLLQRKPEPDGLHRITHTLVLVTEVATALQQQLTTEKRLEQLEVKLEEQAATAHRLHTRFEENEKLITERLQKVEDLLQRVLAGLVGNASLRAQV